MSAPSPVVTTKQGRVESITPPEGVPVHFGISSLGARFGAQALDILITFGGVWLALMLFVWMGGGFLNSAFSSLFYLLVFLVRVPYYIFTELVWNGQTIGKRVTGLRVISADGRRLTPHQIVARNLMKEVEVFMPALLLLASSALSPIMSVVMWVWLIIIFIVPLRSKRRQRLGDMIAGTIVVDNPKAVLLKDLASEKPRDRVVFEFQPEHLEFYGRFELQTLEDILRNDNGSMDSINNMRKVVQTIIRKINYTEKVSNGQSKQFLSDFYRQQREYLETKKLFGDARENKFHDRDKKSGQDKASATTAGTGT